eukprot:COSAG02_NODE_64_length_43111_cov_35.627709_14_plen_50_part_00
MLTPDGLSCHIDTPIITDDALFVIKLMPIDRPRHSQRRNLSQLRTLVLG